MNVYISFATCSNRRQKRLILQTITGKMNLSDDVDLEDFVNRPDKLSCADMHSIVQEVSKITKQLCILSFSIAASLLSLDNYCSCNQTLIKTFDVSIVVLTFGLFCVDCHSISYSRTTTADMH